MNEEELEAGQALDVKIAERVMDFTLDWNHTAMREFTESPEDREANHGRGVYMRCPGCDRHGYGNEIDFTLPCPTPVCPPYSTDVNAAWRVVEHLRAQGWVMSLSVNEFITEPWDCRWFHGEDKRAIGHGATAPLAICRAVLAAIGDHPDATE